MTSTIIGANDGVLAIYGLSSTELTSSNGESPTSKIPLILEKLRDVNSPQELLLTICSGMVSWQSIARGDAFERFIITHSEGIFAFLVRSFLHEAQIETSSDAQLPAYYIACCINRQARNPTSPSFGRKISEYIVTLIAELTTNNIRMRDKLPNIKETNVTTRTESVKLLMKCIVTEDDMTAQAVIPILLKFLVMLSDWKTSPQLRKDVIDWLLCIDKRNRSLYYNYVGDLVHTMRLGEVDELLCILQGDNTLFTVIAPEVLLHNVHFLITTLGYELLSNSLEYAAHSNEGVLKLCAGVPGLVRDPIVTGGGTLSSGFHSNILGSLFSLLLRIAIVKPDAVSRHMNICVKVVFPGIHRNKSQRKSFVDNQSVNYPGKDINRKSSEIGLLVETNTEIVEGVEQEKYVCAAVNAKWDLLVPLAKLLAATALHGVEESYYSLEVLSKIIRVSMASSSDASNSYKLKSKDQAVLIGKY